MHPLVRLVTVLLFAGFLPFLPPAGLALAAVGLAVFILILSPQALYRAALAVWNIRWLLVSIAILYGWFTPGTPLSEALGRASPTVEGMQEALIRSGVLVIMVAVVVLLFAITKREQLIAAIAQSVHIFKPLGLEPAVFGSRLVMSIENVRVLREALLAVRQARAAEQRDPWQAVADIVLAIESHTVEKASASGDENTVTYELSAPRWFEWWPAIVLGSVACLAVTL